MPRMTISEKLRSLRVAFMSDAIQDRNGVGVYYHDLAEHMERYLGRVAILCPGSRQHPEVQGWSIPLPGDKTQRLYMPSLRRTGGTLRRIRPHIIVLATPGPFGLYGLVKSKFYNAKTVVGFHTDLEGLSDLYWKNQAIGSLFTGSLRALHRGVFYTSSMTVSFNEDMVETARKHGAKKARLVATPIARHFLEAPTTPQEGQIRSVLYAGRVAPEKNVEAVLEAAEQLPHIQFRIAGDGPLRDHIIQKTKELSNLKFLGWVTRNKVRETIDSADMLVLPSHVESFGTIALEAMARKRLVVVSRRCGIAEWPTLAPGIFRLEEGETVAQGIKRIDALPAEEKIRISQYAGEAAAEQTSRALEEWLQIFADIMGWTKKKKAGRVIKTPEKARRLSAR